MLDLLRMRQEKAKQSTLCVFRQPLQVAFFSDDLWDLVQLVYKRGNALARAKWRKSKKQ